MNETTANAASSATKPEPSRTGIGRITGMKAPTTQAIWKRASNRENDRPWLASGASRCTSESKARRATAAARATPPASSAIPIRPPVIEPRRAAASPRPSEPSSISSSTTLRRRMGATCTPVKAESPATATTTA